MVTRYNENEYTLTNAYIWFLLPSGSSFSTSSGVPQVDP